MSLYHQPMNYYNPYSPPVHYFHLPRRRNYRGPRTFEDSNHLRIGTDEFGNPSNPFQHTAEDRSYPHKPKEPPLIVLPNKNVQIYPANEVHQPLVPVVPRRHKGWTVGTVLGIIGGVLGGLGTIVLAPIKVITSVIPVTVITIIQNYAPVILITVMVMAFGKPCGVLPIKPLNPGIMIEHNKPIFGGDDTVTLDFSKPNKADLLQKVVDFLSGFDDSGCLSMITCTLSRSQGFETEWQQWRHWKYDLHASPKFQKDACFREFSKCSFTTSTFTHSLKSNFHKLFFMKDLFKVNIFKNAKRLWNNSYDNIAAELNIKNLPSKYITFNMKEKNDKVKAEAEIDIQDKPEKVFTLDIQKKPPINVEASNIPYKVFSLANEKPKKVINIYTSDKKKKFHINKL